MEMVLPHHIITWLISGRPHVEPTGALASGLLRAVSPSFFDGLSRRDGSHGPCLLLNTSSARSHQLLLLFMKTQTVTRHNVMATQGCPFDREKCPRSKGWKMSLQDGNTLKCWKIEIDTWCVTNQNATWLNSDISWFYWIHVRYFIYPSILHYQISIFVYCQKYHKLNKCRHI